MIWSLCTAPVLLVPLHVALFPCVLGFLQLLVSFWSWKKKFGEVLWSLGWMCPPQMMSSAWSSFSKSGHVYKYPGCKSVPELVYGHKFSSFPFSPAALLGSEKPSLLLLGWGRKSSSNSGLPLHPGCMAKGTLQPSSVTWGRPPPRPSAVRGPPHHSQLRDGQTSSGTGSSVALTFCSPLYCRTPSEKCPGNPTL